jgi:hypothetical protein
LISHHAYHNVVVFFKEIILSANQNCWESEKCGREPNGINAGKTGVCPAAIETKLDGVHGGRNAGRACWVVAGTLCRCRGKVQGVFARKYTTCMDCDFYQKVQEENFTNFQLSVVLLQRLRKTH